MTSIKRYTNIICDGWDPGSGAACPAMSRRAGGGGRGRRERQVFLSQRALAKTGSMSEFGLERLFSVNDRVLPQFIKIGS